MSAHKDSGDTVDHVEAVYRETRYIKAEESYYAARVQKLSEEANQLRETIQLLNDQLHSLREELRNSLEELNAAKGASLALRQKLQASSDELETRLREIQRMRNSRSWRITRLLRRSGEFE
jgi:predicted  nucleic acid-binding Zn-ribbon protein